MLAVYKKGSQAVCLLKKITVLKSLVFVHCLFLSLIWGTSSYAWNSLGHRLIMQIAYDNMSQQAKEVFSKYNKLLETFYVPQTLVFSADWMDRLRYKNELWMNKIHYINLPFSVDGTPLPSTDRPNAVTAILDAQKVIKSGSREFDKGFAVRILIHVAGDIHQPLHAATRFSAKLPNGDAGGNLVRLGDNPIANNLHAYWDKGAGFLMSEDRSPEFIEKKALEVEQQYPCDIANVTLSPNKWAEESHDLAENFAYKIAPYEVPSSSYQQMVQGIVKQRVALAGCRIAALLNKLT